MVDSFRLVRFSQSPAGGVNAEVIHETDNEADANSVYNTVPRDLRNERVDLLRVRQEGGVISLGHIGALAIPGKTADEVSRMMVQAHENAMRDRS